MSYNKKALRVDLGKYYKPNPYKKDIITDPAGQWKYPGQPTRIPGNEITMQGIPYPVYGQDDQGNGQIMYPGQNYVFPGNYVDEIPMAQQGLSVNSIVNTPRSLAYNNKKITKGITTLPEIPIHPPKDEDSNAENLWEIVDPTGYSSWDDVAKAYKKSGVSWETALEVLGAIPFLGKIGKSGKVIAGGFGLLQDAIKASKYLPAKEQKAFIDAAYKGYQKYAKTGGKELDEVLGKSTEIIKNNVPFLNPEKWESSSKAINAANKSFKIGKATDAYQAYDQWNPIQLDEGFAQGGAIPELPLTAGRKAYRTWGYTNNDFIVNRQEGGVNSLEGDLISKVIMNRNRDVDFVDRAYALGDNPGTPMFNVPDDEEFGSHMSHKMAWGTDDNGQAFMFPTVLNPNNEAIPVPNQYADYISSVGYKNATGMTPTEDYIEADLTPEEIEQYRQGGYIVEDISVPSLNSFAPGGINTPTDLSPENLNYYLAKLRFLENSVKKGYKNKKWYPYESIEGGNDTIAYGHKILPGESFDKGLTEAQARKLQREDALEKQRLAEYQVDKKYGKGTFDSLPQNHQMLLLDYQYNVSGGLNEFPNFTKALVESDKAKALSEYEREKLGQRNKWTKDVLENTYFPKQVDDTKPKLAEGGYTELELTPEEIQAYVDQGYTVEDID
jgi:hypothetical protein